MLRLPLALVVAAACVAPIAAGGREPAPPSVGLAQVTPPPVSAAAVLVADLTTGVEIYAANADAQLPPASTMKIVTALVAATIFDLDEQ